MVCNIGSSLFVEDFPYGVGGVGFLMNLFQFQQFAIDAVGKAVNTFIFIVNIDLDKLSNGAIARTETGFVRQFGESVPYVESHSVAHTDTVDGHCIENPR